MEMSLVDSLWFTRHTCQYCPTGQTPYIMAAASPTLAISAAVLTLHNKIIPQSIPRFLPPVHQSVSNRIQRPVVALYQLSDTEGGRAMHRRIVVMMMTTRRYREARRNV